MLAHLVDDFVAERDKKELRAFASGEFHRRDKIAIPSVSGGVHPRINGEQRGGWNHKM